MKKSSKAKEIGLKGKYVHVLYLMDIRMNITVFFNRKIWIKIRSNVL